jgi:hypothetical protein
MLFKTRVDLELFSKLRIDPILLEYIMRWSFKKSETNFEENGKSSADWIAGESLD